MHGLVGIGRRHEDHRQQITGKVRPIDGCVPMFILSKSYLGMLLYAMTRARRFFPRNPEQAKGATSFSM